MPVLWLGDGGFEPYRASTRVVEARKAAVGAAPPAPTRDAYRPPRLARDAMTSPVAVLPAEASFLEARDLMAGRRIRHVPIVRDDGAILGIVSDRDLLRGVPNPAHQILRNGPLRPPDTAGYLMSTRVLTATPETEIREIARVMVEEHIACVPVLDAGRRPVGILTSTDILRAVVRHSPPDSWI